jgi:hypothetical protein
MKPIRKERWTGRLLTLEQARQISAVDDILLTKNLWVKLEAVLAAKALMGRSSSFIWI